MTNLDIGIAVQVVSDDSGYAFRIQADTQVNMGPESQAVHNQDVTCIISLFHYRGSPVACEVAACVPLNTLRCVEISNPPQRYNDKMSRNLKT